jgi:hypothetical protein
LSIGEFGVSFIALCEEKGDKPADYSGSCFCISSIISDLTGIASTAPNLVQASAPAADANLASYLLLKKALKSNFMKESTAFLG